MDNDRNHKPYNLEERTLEFAKAVIRLCKKLSKNTINNELVAQVVRSSGSVGANYREANDALGKKDFIQRLRIARKETKETIHWLQILKVSEEKLSTKIENLIDEAIELRNILSAIIKKSIC